MKDLDTVFARLSTSAFRRRFRLQQREIDYLHRRGMPVMLSHAEEFIAKRLAPADPANDGNQTPFRGHPIFVAQHATATCCRGCLEKWHGIRCGRELTQEERAHVIAALSRWLEAQGGTSCE